jgi:hypothetical protein
MSNTYLMFLREFHGRLVGGIKRTTRRIFQSTSRYNLHKRRFDQQQLVRVWIGQGHDTTIGYILYTTFYQQRVGDITKAELVDEGCISMSVENFIMKYFTKQSPDKKTKKKRPRLTYEQAIEQDCTVINFKFFPVRLVVI